MGRFHIRRKTMPQGLSAQKQQVYEGGVATTPERLMATITNTMGEVVNSPEEFEELCALLIVKGSDWVKTVAKMRDFQAEVDRKKKAPPLVL